VKIGASKLLAVLIMSLAMRAGAARAEDVGTDVLRIELIAKGARQPPTPKKARAAYNKGFKLGCEELGKALSAGKGPWGFGVFETYGCYRGRRRVAGADRLGKWRLAIVDGVEGVTLTMTRAGEVVTSLALPPSEHTMEFLRDEEFVDSLAMTLLAGMPMAMVVTQSQLQGNAIVGRHFRAGKASDFKFNGNEPLEPPARLTLYRLAWDADAKRWRAQVVGAAQRGRIEPPAKKTETLKKGKERTTLQGGSVAYEVTTPVIAALASGPLYAQDSEGPGARATALAENAKEAQEAMDDAAGSGHLSQFMRTGPQGLLSSLLDSAASGYVGLRYGREIIPGEGELAKLINNTQMLGLLVEIRGGPAKGLRYYYDKLFKTTAKLQGDKGSVKASVEFARHVVGFSWDFAPGFLVDKVTVDPKLGMWTFNATLPTALDANGKVAQMDDFNLGRTFSLALELGVEEVSDWYTLRGYYALNSGFSIIKSGGKVTSNAFGADAYFTAGPTFPLFGMSMRTALLAFYVFEQTTITGPKETPAPGTIVASGLDYTAGYAGGGVALSW
jgi:hypothetical protein